MADKTGDLTRHAAEPVTAVMESTLSSLSDNARKALKYASLMAPDAVAAGWLPELCGLNEEDGVEVLNELIGYSLLTQLETDPNIARMHRLAAEAVKQGISEGVKKIYIAKIREKCYELLLKDKAFWRSPENFWNITSVSEFCLTIAEQWTVEGSEKDIDWNLTWMLSSSGKILETLEKMKEAKNVFQKMFTICEQRIKLFPSNIDIQLDMRNSCSHLGDLDKQFGYLSDAFEWDEKALDIDLQLLKTEPDEVIFQQCLIDLYQRCRSIFTICELFGDFEKSEGNIDAAKTWYENSLDFSQKLAEKFPENIQVQRDLVRVQEKLAQLQK